MQKNDMAVVKITDMGVNGEGIGKSDGYPLFIKDAVMGDTVEAKVMKAKKNYGYGRLMKVIEPSADRVEPKCPFARRCGGCQIQEMSYERQLVFKNQKVRNSLERIGGFSPELLNRVTEPIVGMDEPFFYRNKAQFPLARTKKEIRWQGSTPDAPTISSPIQTVLLACLSIGRSWRLSLIL